MTKNHSLRCGVLFIHAEERSKRFRISVVIFTLK